MKDSSCSERQFVCDKNNLKYIVTLRKNLKNVTKVEILVIETKTIETLSKSTVSKSATSTLGKRLITIERHRHSIIAATRNGSLLFA